MAARTLLQRWCRDPDISRGASRDGLATTMIDCAGSTGMFRPGAAQIPASPEFPATEPFIARLGLPGTYEIGTESVQSRPAVASLCPARQCSFIIRSYPFQRT